MLDQQGLQVIGQSSADAKEMEAVALVASVTADEFLSNKHFTEEVFGPYSLAVICDDKATVKAMFTKFKRSAYINNNGNS